LNLPERVLTRPLYTPQLAAQCETSKLEAIFGRADM